MFIGVLIIAALLTAAAAISYYTYRKVFRSDRSRQKQCADNVDRAGAASGRVLELVRELKDLPREDVYIYSFDGLKLYGRYYHVRDNAPLEIQFHGYNGSALRDFCGGNKIARDAGRNTLLVDQRAHGNSMGKTITFGINERRDCLAWIQYALDRFGGGQEIILSGVSMGAATVLMSLSLSLPQNVKAVVADCGYSSPKEIIKKVARDRGFPPSLTYPFIWLGALVFGKFNLTATDALKSAVAGSIPVLIIHGEADDFVPCYMAEEIYDALSCKKAILTVPEAGHGLSYVKDGKLYEDTVNNFIEQALCK